MIKLLTVPSSTLALAAATAALLGGCGSTTKTVSAASSPPSAGTAKATTRTGTVPSAPTTPAGTNGASSPSTTSRTAPQPEFAQRESSAEGLASALAVLRAHGYTATDSADYRSDQTLRVLVGTRAGSAGAHDQQAFFFLDGRYLGTDASQPSAQLKVLNQSDTEVTLAYALYRSDDPLCCPGGGEAKVRFQLNNGQLAPLDPIPPIDSTSSSPGRR